MRVVVPQGKLHPLVKTNWVGAAKIGKVPATQAWGPEFDPQYPYKKTGAGALIVIIPNWGGRHGRIPGLTGQPNLGKRMSSRSVKDHIFKK